MISITKRNRTGLPARRVICDPFTGFHTMDRLFDEKTNIDAR